MQQVGKRKYHVFWVTLPVIFLVFLGYRYLDNLGVFEKKTQETLTKQSSGIVVEVQDGDTIKVDIDGKLSWVRLIGIDAPEGSACMSSQSTSFAKAFLYGKQVSLITEPRENNQDSKGRLIRYVTLEGDDFAIRMIKEGYAKVKTSYRFAKQDEYIQVQKRVVELQKGVWSQTCQK